MVPRADCWLSADREVGRLLESVQADSDYTVLYFSNPHESKLYEADFADPVHIELKRQSDTVFVGRRQANATDKASLFDKYQFLSPGITMGLVVGFVILSILYVGLSALSSLQVSYAAFEKEMGPAAHKKQQ